MKTLPEGSTSASWKGARNCLKVYDIRYQGRYGTEGDLHFKILPGILKLSHAQT